MAMPNWECTFDVNGKSCKVIIGANSSFDAEKIIRAQYANCKITFFRCKRLS